MDGYVCSIAGAKGGVGKTTTAINLGVALSLEGHDVVVVDTDLRTPDLGRMLGIDVDRGIHSVLSGEAFLENALVEVEAGVHVLPGEEGLHAVSDADPDELAGLLDELSDRFDVVLVDTGAGLTNAVVVALAASDGVLCLSKTSSTSIDDAKSTIDLVDRAGANTIGSLVTCANETDGITDIFDDVPLLGVTPADRTVIGDEPLVHSHPDSDVAAAYRALAELLEQIIFDGATPEDLETAFVDEWIENNTEESADDEDEGGGFGLF